MSINMLNPHVNSLSYLSFEQDKLLTFEETLLLRKLHGFGVGEYSSRILKTMFNTLEEQKIITPTQLWLLYKDRLKVEIQERRQAKIHKDIDMLFLDYLLMNMAYSRIDFNIEFLDKFVLYTSKVTRRKLMENYYDIKKLEQFPEIASINFKEHKRFLIILAAVLLNSPKGLSEDKIIWELFNAYTRNKYKETGKLKGATNLTAFLQEFTTKIYPAFLENGLMEKRENIYQFLYDKYKNLKSDTQLMREYFENKTEGLENTEFYNVLNEYLESKIEDEKLTVSTSTMYSYIHLWSLLSGYCLDEGCKTIKDINSYHRDLLLDFHDKKDKKRVLERIRSVLNFYNETYHGENIEDYYDISIFENKWGKGSGTNLNHASLEGPALGSVIYSLAKEISITRKTPFEKKDQREQLRFFIVRMLWFVLLLGRRMFELRHLKLSRVKDSLDVQDSYIYVVTAKGSDDGSHTLERGKLIGDNKYEFDYIHLQIFKEIIKASEFVYANSTIPTKDQYLFPSSRSLKAIHSQTISGHFRKIQRDNDIVHGSPVSFKNKDFYESSPEWEKMKGTHLFTPHTLRRININLLHVNGHLPLSSIIDIIGHRSHESIGAYTRTMLTVYQVFKLLEKHGHIGAANKLVSMYYEEIPEEIDRTLLIKLEDFLAFLAEFDLELENLISTNSPDSSEFTEIDSNCVTEISCADTGMACLGCKDFRAGKMTLESLINVRAMFGKEYQNIDAIIKQINMRKKDILKNGHKKVVYINMFSSLIDRFLRCSDAIKTTLESKETGWGLSEKEIRQILHSIRLKTRKNDLDKDIVKYINECRRKKLFDDIDFTVYRSIKNMVVFR